MTFSEFKQRQIELLNIVAPAIVAFHKKSKMQQVIAIVKGTGSAYLAEKWQGEDFAHRYLNSDSQNKERWLIMMGVKNPSVMDCEILRQAMMYFYNHSIDTVLTMDFLKREKLKAYGNGLNWCKAWVKLSVENRALAASHFHD